MGPGGSQEAAFDLRASVPAGNYHVECDAVVTGSVDVQFRLIWRRGATDTMLAQWIQHWEPRSDGTFDAQAYEVDMAAQAITFQPGDQLVFGYAATHTSKPNAFIPNGGEPSSHGRIPSITLPQ